MTTTDKIEQNPLFPQGDKANPDYFTGNAWVKLLVSENEFNSVIANVTFEAGARNNWHTHPGGQILIATDGIGYYQEKGKPIQLIQSGDVIKIPANVKHWHGASRDNNLTHIAITAVTPKGSIDWLERVTNEEFNSYNQ
ncbi:cupin domain-containing protein [Flavobacterium aquariorum]|uniref:Cupin domain-containing protein n=1 Tax=Flavobacterium aquariorum TaxID=2217670 RepID=A0A2W7UHQ1_9FLAO|nr:cupin domain-containing protein [Flavobacterium aquariorum]PZX94717.1 cupin domain-containing protein [Flavobacterium aquariorum]